MQRLPQSFITLTFAFFNQQVSFILRFQRPGPVPEFHVKNKHSGFSWHFCWHSTALEIFFKRYRMPGFLIAPPLKWVFSSRHVGAGGACVVSGACVGTGVSKNIHFLFKALI